MSNENSYKETRSFLCTACGTEVIATKFASQKSIRCDKCKADNRPINPDIVSQALGKNPPKESKSNATVNTGNTKDRPCTKCGEMTTVSKFMSDNNVLCSNCKPVKDEKSKDKPVVTKVKIDRSKLTMSDDINEYVVMPSVIANPKLRKIVCPACGSMHTRILGINDVSDFGAVIHYQCSDCKLLISISEQTKWDVKPYKAGLLYDYTGRACEELITSVPHTRISNTLRRLVDLIKEHNINIDGIKLPDIIYQDQYNKPVPTGLIINQNIEECNNGIEETINDNNTDTEECTTSTGAETTGE